MTDSFEMEALAKKYGDFTSPTVQVLIADTELKTEEGLWLEQAEVMASVFYEPDMAVLYYGVRSAVSKVQKLEKRLALGRKIEIRAGYGKEVLRIFYGYIHEISVRREEKDFMEYELICLDVKGLMRLNSTYGISGTRKTEQVLSAVLGDAMYAPFIEGKTVEKLPASMNEPCMLGGETHYEWLCRLADYLQYSFFINRGRLYFGPDRKDTGIMTKLSENCVIHRICTTATLSDQAGVIEVNGFNREDERLFARAYFKAPGGPFEQELKRVLSGSRRVCSAGFLSANEQASVRAKALMHKAVKACSGMEIVAEGVPEMQPGAYIKVADNISESFSGRIYVEEVSHKLGADGYRMVIKGHR